MSIFCLTQEKAISRGGNHKTKKRIQCSQVFRGKLSMKLLNKISKETSIVANDSNIINIEQYVKDNVGSSIDKKRGVGCAASETKTK